MPIKQHRTHLRIIESISMSTSSIRPIGCHHSIDIFRNKTDSSQQRKGPAPTPLLTTNGQSDFDSGDETHQNTPAYNNETFTR